MTLESASIKWRIEHEGKGFNVITLEKIQAYCYLIAVGRFLGT